MNRRLILVGLFLLTALTVPSVPVLSANHHASFQPSSYQVNEGNQEVEITVSRGGPSTDPASIGWETIDGTAKAGDQDYVASSGTATFGTGAVTTKIKVNTRDDTGDENNESFQVRFKEDSETGTITENGGPATVTIVDNDNPPPPPPPPAESPRPKASPSPAAASPAPPVAVPTLSPTLTPTPSPSVSASPTPLARAQDGGGFPVAGIIAIVAVLIAAGAGGGLWWLRRRAA